jgi:hypothetical protein
MGETVSIWGDHTPIGIRDMRGFWVVWSWSEDKGIYVKGAPVSYRQARRAVYKGGKV